jgi:hypothetical protein
VSDTSNLTAAILGSCVLCAVVVAAVVREWWRLAGERVARRRWT